MHSPQLCSRDLLPAVAQQHHKVGICRHKTCTRSVNMTPCLFTLCRHTARYAWCTEGCPYSCQARVQLPHKVKPATFIYNVLVATGLCVQHDLCQYQPARQVAECHNCLRQSGNGNLLAAAAESSPQTQPLASQGRQAMQLSIKHHTIGS